MMKYLITLFLLISLFACKDKVEKPKENPLIKLQENTETQVKKQLDDINKAKQAQLDAIDNQ